MTEARTDEIPCFFPASRENLLSPMIGSGFSLSALCGGVLSGCMSRGRVPRMARLRGAMGSPACGPRACSNIARRGGTAPAGHGTDGRRAAIPAPSLFGRAGSLFGRFNSLLDRLGNFPFESCKMNDLRVQIRSANCPQVDFSQYFPMLQGTKAGHRPPPRRPSPPLDSR